MIIIPIKMNIRPLILLTDREGSSAHSLDDTQKSRKIRVYKINPLFFTGILPPVVDNIAKAINPIATTSISCPPGIVSAIYDPA